MSFTEDLIAFVNFTPNVVEEGERCNGPEGSRCKDGLVCVLDNDITNVVDEFTSNEYGTCMDEDSDVPVDPEESKTVTEEYEDSVTKGAWIHYGPFNSKQDIDVVMSGTNDADLYVKKDSQPTSSDYDCRPYKSGSAENCSLEGSGDFFVSVNG